MLELFRIAAIPCLLTDINCLIQITIDLVPTHKSHLKLLNEAVSKYKASH